MSSSHQLAAIMFTDIVGYSAMMEENEEKAVAVIKHYNISLKKWVSYFNGQVLNYYGDGSLSIFSSATDAVNCSLAVQKELKAEPVVPLRIGLHIGEVFFEDKKALGDGVNVASRIQSLGQENTILVSDEFHDKIKNNPSITTISLGHFEFKNIEKALEVFALTNEGLFVPQRKSIEGKLKKKKYQKLRVIAAISFILLVVVSFFVYKENFSKNDSPGIDKSIAVLPFVNMSNDKNQEYFSDGLSEELLNLLSRMSELKVIGRTSSFSFKGKNEDLRIIGGKLGVANLLEGSVQKEGNKIRVTAQLIRTADGSQLWSEKYDRDVEGIFQLQDEIAGAVVKQLKLKLLSMPTSGAAQTNMEVYDLILQGNYFAEKRDKENLAKALEFYLKALVIDSLSARAWAGAARSYDLQSSWDWIDRNKGFEKAREAASKALALDPNQVEGHLALGGVDVYYFNWDGAELEFQKAINLEPGNADALRMTGFLSHRTGRFDEGIRLTKLAIALDPVKAVAYYNYGQLLYYANHYEEAIASYKKALEINPQFPRTHTYLGEVYLLQGKPEMALAEMNLETEKVLNEMGMALAYHALGRKNEAAEALTNFILNYQNDWPYINAEIYAFRGEKDKAFEWLEKAYKKKDTWLIWLKGDPLLKNLEGDPRYAAFLKKMNLPEA
ncbi:MAG: tetratricopeptide repeat protein [Chitinophagales bacterium]